MPKVSKRDRTAREFLLFFTPKGSLANALSECTTPEEMIVGMTNFVADLRAGNIDLPERPLTKKEQDQVALLVDAGIDEDDATARILARRSA